MANIFIFNRSELTGFNRKSAVIESLIQNNALNHMGNTNYNFRRVKDGVGFKNVTEKFVDNILIHVLAPDYNVQKERTFLL